MTGTQMIKEALRQDPNGGFELAVQRKMPEAQSWECVRKAYLPSSMGPKDVEKKVKDMRRLFFDQTIRNTRYSDCAFRLCLLAAWCPILVEYPSKELSYYALSLGDFRHALDRLDVLIGGMNAIKATFPLDKAYDDTLKQADSELSETIGRLCRLRNRERVAVEKAISNAIDIWIKGKDMDDGMAYFAPTDTEGKPEKPKKPIVPLKKTEGKKDE